MGEDDVLASMVTLFMGIGLESRKAKETCTNARLSLVLKDLIYQAGLANGISGKDKTMGTLVYLLATRCAQDLGRYQDTLLAYLKTNKISSVAQLEAAFEYLKSRETITDVTEFERSAGVGVNISADETAQLVAAVLEENKAAILEDRYATNVGSLLGKVREKQKWVDIKTTKEQIEKQLEAMLGPKTSADLEPKKKKDKGKAKADEGSSAASSAVSTPATDGAASSSSSSAMRFQEGEVLRFHKPGENPQINPELMTKHLAATGGKVMTRFPPEPNGYLHIGHAKAININFGYAAANNGSCYLRFDDTNPEAEEHDYFDAIETCVKWLGFTPVKVTATSNYFDELYDIAERMILKGKAYVSHDTAEEMHAQRGGDSMGPRSESNWRNRPAEESLAEFRKMRDGEYAPGQAILRLKIDMTSGNPYMWDPVAYRVLNKSHVRTGDKWKIYPTYDFSHCLTDSMENITHSLCTTEFKLAREAYYWICDAAEVYKPVQWEYGRLSITNTVLSKRKLKQLVEEKHVKGWDDPRIYTLMALMRRGFPPKAINNFVERLGITTSNTIIPVETLEACVRDELNLTATRCKVVLNPLKVTITNYPSGQVEDRTYPKLPTDPSKGNMTVPFCGTIYIDASDFREKDEPEYYRLAPGKEVGLSRAYNITCKSVIKNGDGKVIELLCAYDPENSRKPQAHIHWVAHDPLRKSPVPVEVRLYSALFKSANPDAAPNGFLSDINPDSLVVVPDALADVSVLGAKAGDVFQFERVGYFCVDKDSNGENLIFNRTVTLKEDTRKK